MSISPGYMIGENLVPKEIDFDFIDIPAMADLTDAQYTIYIDSLINVDHHGVLRIAGGPPIACTSGQFTSLLGHLRSLAHRVGTDWKSP
jgi:hypothetical protein